MASILLLETDVGINVNIATVTGTATYTSDGAKKILCDVSLYGVAGNGDYVMYVTRQVSGTSAATIMLPKTTMPAASGETNIGGQSGWVSVGNGDIVKSYVDGLAGDTSVTGVYTRWWGDLETVDANIVQISGDSTAADNLEAQFDGTGVSGDTYPATQAQVNNIAITGAPSYEAPSSYVLSTGTQTGGTYQSVDTSNSIYHVHTDSGGQLSLYYEYTLAGDEIGVEMLFKGRINGTNDSVYLQAYDWTTGTFSTLYTLAGTAGTSDTITSAPLVSKYTGTGANVGKVRIKIVNAVSLTTATLYVDQLIIGKTITSRTVGYANGAVWLDTGLSNTNTASFIDGVADNPVSTLAAARTIASALGLKRIHVSNGSSITLASNSDNLEFLGEGWTLALGGQSIAGTYFEGATVSGIGTGATAPMFKSCLLGTVTLPPSILWNCLLTSNTGGGFTCSGAGDYFFYACASGIAGNNRPSITFFNGDCNVNLRNYSGGITLLSMVTGCDCSVEGRGNCIIDSSCTGGAVVIRGLYTLTNNGTGMSITDAARFAEDQNMQALTNGYVTVTGTVSATVSSPVTVTGYVNVTGTVVASSVTNPVTVGTNNDKSDYLLSSAGVTAITNDVFTEVVEGTTTFKTWLRRMGAVLFGKASGGGVAGSKKFRDITDAVDRVDATTDANGNRTSVTYDDTAT